MKSICVYCGSSDNIDGEYKAAAHQMGTLLAARGLELIYGGGRTGLMGIVADAVLEAGGRVTGVITEQFNTPELAHPGLTAMEIEPSLHTRKARMAELAEGFVALPGGFGTLDELFEIITWAQVGLHEKPIGLLNVNGYFEPLLTFLQHVSNEGFIYTEHHDLYKINGTPEGLLELLNNHRPPEGLERWVQR